MTISRARRVAHQTNQWGEASRGGATPRDGGEFCGGKVADPEHLFTQPETDMESAYKPIVSNRFSKGPTVVQQIEEGTLFHVTREVQYNTHAPLSVGTKIDVGSIKNPFFGFYEGIRAYPVATPEGEVRVPAIKFLKSVASGSINCPILPQIATQIAEHYVMLCRELIMEEVRREVAPVAPSRQSYIWLAETIDEAIHWRSRLTGTTRIATLKVVGTIHRVDAAHLLGDSEPLTKTYEKARAYWRGDESDEPELETLFSGTASVVEILD